MFPTRLFSRILFRPRTASSGVVVILIRLIVGFGFMQHGVAKIMNGPERFGASLSGLGVPAPEIMSWVTIAAEVVCGAAVFVGAFVSLACVPMAVILIVAMVSVHLRFGFSSIKLQAVTSDGIKFGPPGYEVILLYLACISALLILGSGPWSIDSWLESKIRSE
jgi:putative oxidoreductase